MEPITFPSAHTQLHGKHLLEACRATLSLFNDRKLWFTLLKLCECVRVCVYIHHISTSSIELVIIREADDDMFTPRLQS